MFSDHKRTSVDKLFKRFVRRIVPGDCGMKAQAASSAGKNQAQEDKTYDKTYRPCFENKEPISCEGDAKHDEKAEKRPL